MATELNYFQKEAKRLLGCSDVDAIRVINVANEYGEIDWSEWSERSIRTALREIVADMGLLLVLS